MQKLINNVQHYAWGSKTALTELFNLPNPDNLPMAELWMGAHPKSSSQVLQNGKLHSLRALIEAEPTKMLGEIVAQRFGELPFLFKVLCADQPLSIQVHPNKTSAEKGFAKENQAKIALDAAERNYKDANHKPELVFALTPFLAINGFRELSEIATLLQPLTEAHPAISDFLNQPNAESLSRLFSGLLSMAGDEKSRALACLNEVLEHQQAEPWDTIRLIANYYPHDSGLLSPLLLNVITLQPGEAMFLFAETPHAYLQGVALEVMANSDNVLRAGLTPKYIDIPELVANVKFSAKPANQVLTRPEQQGNSLNFSVPVPDFAFSVDTLGSNATEINHSSAAIVFCIEGQALLSKNQQQLVLKPGESAFISAEEFPITLSGSGRVARIYNQFCIA